MSVVVRETNAAGLVTETRVDPVWVHRKTAWQEVLIGEGPYGRTLFLDGNTQSCVSDEGVYHAALVHPALFTHPNPRRVLIGGGGEGATLREVLRHPGIERAVMVDIDEEGVALFRDELPEFHQGAFDDPRSELVHEDIQTWLADRTPESFDVVILDLGDPLQGGPSEIGFTEGFFGACRRILAEDGVLVTQAGEFEIEAQNRFPAILNSIRSVFRHALPFNTYVPCFAASWGFIMASDKPIDAAPPRLTERWRQAGGESWDHYDPDGHRAWMWIPPVTRRRLLVTRGP